MGNPSADRSAYHSNAVEHNGVEGPARAHSDQAPRNLSLSDNRLIVQIGRHNERALGTLYDRYGALVYTLALRITQDRTVAETVVQDVFQVVWQSASCFQSGASVPVWLIRITRQRAIDAAQSPGSPPHAPTATSNQTQTTHSDEQSAGATDGLKVRRVLDALPIDQREAIELAYYDSLTCREIAMRLRESLSVIKARLRVGLFKLHQQLRNDADD